MFLEITTIICTATLLAVFFKLLKQPPILAYILTGLLFGPIGILHLENKEVLSTFGEFGITFLLFMLGLELRLSELRSVGKIAIVTGIAQIVFTALVGYALCLFLGFSSVPALYISLALTFSSTIIVVKLLSEKKDLTSLYGKIALGILLAQDFVAILILIFLSSFTQNQYTFSLITLFPAIGKGIILFASIIILSKTVLPKFLDSIARSEELIFIFSLSLAFGLSALVSSPIIGFSQEIGGFLAGLSLANSTENFQIAARVKPLRDFFITIFFVLLGTNMIILNPAAVIIPSIIFSAFVLIGNPLIVMIILGLLGYKKRTSFLAGLTVAQISEFSLILIFLGQKIGHISPEDNVITIITIVGIATFVVSTYMILYGTKLYALASPFLSIFERKNLNKEVNLEDSFEDHVLLIGANRTGQSIIDSLKPSNHKIIIVDFDPDVISFFKNKNIPVIFGDITDPEIQQRANIDKAKLIISTVQDVKDNLVLIQAFRKKQKRGKIIILAQDKNDSDLLYKNGADFVVIPHLSGGIHIASILREENFNLKKNYDFKA